MFSVSSLERTAFSKKYKKTRFEVVYSDEHIKRLGQNVCPFKAEDLAKYDALHATTRPPPPAVTRWPSIGDKPNEVFEDLSNIYLPFKRILSLGSALGGGLNTPDLLLINLITQQIFFVILKRKVALLVLYFSESRDQTSRLNISGLDLFNFSRTFERM